MKDPNDIHKMQDQNDNAIYAVLSGSSPFCHQSKSAKGTTSRICISLT